MNKTQTHHISKTCRGNSITKQETRQDEPFMTIATSATSRIRGELVTLLRSQWKQTDNKLWCCQILSLLSQLPIHVHCDDDFFLVQSSLLSPDSTGLTNDHSIVALSHTFQVRTTALLVPCVPLVEGHNSGCSFHVQKMQRDHQRPSSLIER